MPKNINNLHKAFKVIYEYNTPVISFRLLKNIKTNMIYPQYQHSLYWQEVDTKLICTPVKNGKYIGDEAVTKMYTDQLDEIILILVAKLCRKTILKA